MSGFCWLPRTRPKDEEALKDERIKKLERMIGEMVLDMDILQEGVRPTSLWTARRQASPEQIVGVSQRKVCGVLQVSRSVLHERPRRESLLRARIARLIQQHPTFGYRRIWALLRFREKLPINRKTVYGVLRRQQWFVHQRRVTPRPRVKRWRSQTDRSDKRWAMDVTHIPCGSDDWAHLAAVIDCHDREIVGWEFALRGRAKKAERALEEAYLGRFGTLRPDGSTPVLRSDNGLIFQSRRFRQACRDYRLRQEFTTPYTPEQNGPIERFFRSLKEECTWQTNFRSFREAERTVGRWIEWYNASRPHQALGYLSPREYRAQQLNSVAC